MNTSSLTRSHIKGTRGQGDQGTRGPGDQGTRGPGDKGTRGPGDKGTRGQGDKGTRGLGDTGRDKGVVDPKGLMILILLGFYKFKTHLPSGSGPSLSSA